MTQLEQMKTIFTHFSEAENSKFIKYEHTAPDFIIETYNRLCNSITKHYGCFKQAALLLGISNSYFNEFEKINTDLRESVVIGGGSISDFVMHRELGVAYNPKDVDIFVQRLIPDFFKEIIEIGSVDDPYFGYNLFHEMNYLGLPGLIEYATSEEVMGLSLGYVIFSFAVKETLDENSSEWTQNHHYKMEYIHYLERGTLLGKDVEVIICDNNKILNFDLIFKSCYYTNNQIYLLDSALSDIRNKVIHIANANSPLTTLLRALYFEDKFGFEIEPYSFKALNEFIHNSDYSTNHFIESTWGHPKCTSVVRNKIMDIFDFSKTCTITQNGSYKDSYNPVTLKYFKNETAGLFAFIDDFDSSQMFFSKTLSLLKTIKNFKTIKCIFKRPDNWHDSIFTKELSGISFTDWYNSAFLYNSLVPISEHKDFLLKLVTSKEIQTDFKYAREKNFYELDTLKPYLSALVKSDTFHFVIRVNNIFELLFNRRTTCSELDVSFDQNGKLQFENNITESYEIPSTWLNSLNNFYNSIPAYRPIELDGFYYRDLLK